MLLLPPPGEKRRRKRRKGGTEIITPTDGGVGVGVTVQLGAPVGVGVSLPGGKSVEVEAVPQCGGDQDGHHPPHLRAPDQLRPGGLPQPAVV